LKAEYERQLAIWHIGIDRVNNAMHKISIWKSIADANKMVTFAPMLALASEFTRSGSASNAPF
jgi:hypothetical protein